MALHFVKTAVLSSEDGIDFSKETTIESEEAKQARLLAERANAKPLYQQLAEQKERKQEEYDANTKLLFAPPKALDEEEVTFLQSIEDHRSKKEQLQKQAEIAALESFRAAQRQEIEELLHKPASKPFIIGIQSSNSKPSAVIMPQVVVKGQYTQDKHYLKTVVLIFLVVSAKRKRNPEENQPVIQKNARKENSAKVGKEERIEDLKFDIDTGDSPDGGLSLLCDYGSSDCDQVKIYYEK